VVENEIGQEGIDHELLLQQTQKENIILMNNGCVCCTVRGDLITTFHELFKSDSFSKIDWIVIETTGLADPAPVIQSLYMDKQCSKCMRLDGVITVVDSKHVKGHIGE
jgi:G3E family GTPase